MTDGRFSFFVKFLACLLCPSLLEEPSYPQDIKEKARRILEATEQFSIGAICTFFQTHKIATLFSVFSLLNTV